MEMGRHPRAGRRRRGEDGRSPRLYSRTGEDISGSFPDLARGAAASGRDRRRASDRARGPRAELQRPAAAAQPQSRQRRSCSPSFPRICAPTTSWSTATRTCASAPFAERRARLEAFVARLGEPRIDLSPLVPFATWDELAAARADPAAPAPAPTPRRSKGVMLKRRDALYVPGRPKGPWWKWKRDPFVVDAVLMYAQRGHGKRSSFYSDYTFGVWTSGERRRRAGAGRQGLFRLHRRGADADRPLRAPQHRRALRPGARGRARAATRAWCSKSPSRDCSARPGTNPASRCAFPRISRLRWDKPPARGRPAGDAGAMLHEDRSRTRCA